MAASKGQLTAIGTKTGQQYLIQLYQPDAVATKFTFNPSGLAGATSPPTYRFPEDVVIRDMSIVTGATATGGIMEINGALLNGTAMDWTVHLSTLPQRPMLNIPVRGGDDFSILQF